MERNIGKQRDCRGRCSDCNWFPTRVEQRTFGLFERPHHFITPPTFYFFYFSSLSLFPSLLFFSSFLLLCLVSFFFFFLMLFIPPHPNQPNKTTKQNDLGKFFFFCVYKFSPSSFRWRSIRLYNEKWINTKFRLQYMKYTAVIYENPPLLLIRNIWIEPR